jgi:hypothetical protein
LVRDLLTLSDGLPSAAGCGHRIDGGGPEVPVDTEKALEIRHLAAERHAGPKRIGDLLPLYDVRMGSEERHDGVVLTELIGKKLADVTPVNGSKPIELETGDRPVPEFHLSHGRTGRSKALRHGLRRHPPGLARHAKPPPQLLLADGHPPSSCAVYG